MNAPEKIERWRAHARETEQLLAKLGHEFCVFDHLDALTTHLTSFYADVAEIEAELVDERAHCCKLIDERDRLLEALGDGHDDEDWPPDLVCVLCSSADDPSACLANGFEFCGVCIERLRALGIFDAELRYIPLPSAEAAELDDAGALPTEEP